MNSLFNQSDVAAVLARIDKLTPASEKQWGKMNAARMLAHCNVSMETAMGKNVVPRVFFIARLIGALLKPAALSEKPLSKNSPTDKSYIFEDDCNFAAEKSKLKALVQKFLEGGASQCTVHPHPFFGNFTPEEWAVFQWKHLDHHLRQFNV